LRALTLIGEDLDKLIIVTTVTLILGFLFSAAGRAKPIKTEGGEYVLEYANTLKLFGLAFPIVLFAGLTIALYLKTPTNSEGVIAAACIFLVISVFAIYFYIEFYTVKIIVGTNGIRATSGWKGLRVYRWSDIQKLSYSENSNWFKLTANEKPSLRISTMISGLDQMLAHFEEHVPQEKWAGAFERTKN